MQFEALSFIEEKYYLTLYSSKSLIKNSNLSFVIILLEKNHYTVYSIHFEVTDLEFKYFFYRLIHFQHFITGAIFSITILSRKLQIDDSLLCLISVSSKFVGSIWTAFVKTDIEMYLSEYFSYFYAIYMVNIMLFYFYFL